jgi:hypothetical protein
VNKRIDKLNGRYENGKLSNDNGDGKNCKQEGENGHQICFDSAMPNPLQII